MNIESMIPVSTDSDCYWHLMEVTTINDHRLEFSIYEVTAWEADESKSPIDVELYLKGCIKWDGCSHVWFGEETDGVQDGYLHLCGKFHWELHAQVMANVYEYASKNIKSYDAEVAE